MTKDASFQGDYYVVFRYFDSLGWGSVTDGPATHKDMLEYVAEALGDDDPSNVRIHRVNVEDGIARDETIDVLEQFFSEETPEDEDEDTHSYFFQRREAMISGHFS